MPSPELAVVVEMLRANPVLGDGSFEELRSGMEEATGQMPLPDDLKLESVDAGGVAAEWSTVDGADSARTLLYLHGGGYTIGSVRTHRHLVAAISRASGMRVLSLDYRLGPEAPFPAAVEDACTGYRFLLEQGLPASRIAIAGDSAGGGLTAAALLALRDSGDPLPAAGVCLSPWLDLTQSGDSIADRAPRDPMLDRATLERMAAAYLNGADPRAPYASPLFAELRGLPPLLLQVGGAEVLYDDATRFAERAAAAGVDVTLEPWDDMVHVWHAFEASLPEARQAIEHVGGFLRERLA